VPELPEVEVVRRGLTARLLGHRILAVRVHRPALRHPIPEKDLARLAAGHTLIAVERRAKYLLLGFSSGFWVVIHLGMSGRLTLVTPETPLELHDHVRFLIEGGLELRLNDPRRFGSLLVMSADELEQLKAGIGPEPFGPDFSATFLMERARRKHQPIKSFLMDSRVVAGIGNIYASEILFAARIRPSCPVVSLDRSEWQRVVDATRRILTKAIACGGTTISDYADCFGELGRFQQELQVYGREGGACTICGAAIVRTVMAGRSTYYCPACQR